MVPRLQLDFEFVWKEGGHKDLMFVTQQHEDVGPDNNDMWVRNLAVNIGWVPKSYVPHVKQFEIECARAPVGVLDGFVCPYEGSQSQRLFIKNDVNVLVSTHTQVGQSEVYEWILGDMPTHPSPTP